MDDSKRFLVEEENENKLLYVRFEYNNAEITKKLRDLCTRKRTSWFNLISDEIIDRFVFDGVNKNNFAQALLFLIQNGWLESNRNIPACKQAFWSAFEEKMNKEMQEFAL